MQFAVEGWAPEYGSSVDDDLAGSTQQIDTQVEVADAAWRPLAPPGSTVPPGRLLFVDGVRRVDARIWIAHEGSSVPALCATIGAGAVLAEGDCARLVDARVERAVFGHGVPLDAIATTCGRYAPVEVAGDTPEALVLALQDRMAALEAEVTRAVGAAPVTVVDGPLRGRGHMPGAVGYVKTQHAQYLPSEHLAVLGALGPGERTPLFAVGGQWRRYSWYTRLPGEHAHARAGLVRCEVGGDTEVADAVALADTVTATLPRFASRPHKDARAPQNLYPIAGLERELRRRLGDPALLERALRKAAATRPAPQRFV